MEFKKNPSEDLVQLFNKRPYQGQSPENSEIIFLSSDANYSPRIYEHEFFKYILEYQDNGVKFWNKYKVHHPFLLDEYPFNKTTDGVPFHNRFKKLGLSCKYANKICFIELLDVPTTGNKSKNITLYKELVSQKHLNYIDKIILSNSNKLIFIPGSVLNDMMSLKKHYNVFNWLNKTHGSNSFSLNIKSNKVKQIYHFSSSQIFNQIDDIRKDIDSWLNKTTNR